MSNFLFMKAEWPTLFKHLKRAEERVNTEPESTAHKCRLVLEEVLFEFFEFEQLELPYAPTIHNLLNEESFRAEVPPLLYNGLHVIRKIGNSASHRGRGVDREKAFTCINYLFGFLKWYARSYAEIEPETPSVFDKTLIPKVGEGNRKIKELQAEFQKEQEAQKALIKQLLEEKEASLLQAQETQQALVRYQAEQEQAKLKIEAQKEERQVMVNPPYTEAETRKHLIDAELNLVGWEVLTVGKELEFPVQGMPKTSDNPKGKGYVDYVLWDDNGLPLAVIEAKRTGKRAETGKNQAFLYANCLEQKYGQRPVIFYTNGYETFIWDDRFYSAPRRVYGFYTKAELQQLILRRTTRKDIREGIVNPEIAGRPYQIEAIQRVAETFVVDGEKGLRGNKRQALLVMATGSGKTRTAGALVEMLSKNNWVKNVLFLADRITLVSQAKKNFGTYLPDYTSVNISEEKDSKDKTARLVFSTYQTIINKIANTKSDEAYYGVGHFDLIILDEAHRSIYNRYYDILEYFDASLVGLTATPKSFIDFNTFDLFACEDNNPTFSYTLDEATPQYLCPFRVKEVKTKFITDGVLYSELSKEEKEHYENSFGDSVSGELPEWTPVHKISPTLNEKQKKVLFNKDTVNKVLDVLMTQGLKIEGGDKIGRTIIFAYNKDHADFIVKCFAEQYPNKPSDFIASIHYGNSHSKGLIEKFCKEEQETPPQIAVSVDMMDTGVDAPRVLNLVFFKKVMSFAKFWQMIGRGTRLCPDVFGVGQDKKEFVIFDVCGNFKYFDEIKPEDLYEPVMAKSMGQQIYESRVLLSQLLIKSGEESYLSFAKALISTAHSAVSKLKKDDFQVNMRLRYVEKFQVRSAWDNLTDEDIKEINEHISILIPPEKELENERRFELLMLKLHIATVGDKKVQEAYHKKLRETAIKLSKKYSIDQVKASKPLLDKMIAVDFYKGLTPKKLEQIRIEIKQLIKFLDTQDVAVVYANYEDSEIVVEEVEYQYDTTSNKEYKERVERFVRENKRNIAVSKLSTNQTITSMELEAFEQILFDGEQRGTKEQFEKVYGDQPLGTFIRSIIGLETSSAQKAFADFIQSGNLTADQMTFVDKIINHLTQKGIVDPSMLFEPPFTDMSEDGIYGVFDEGSAFKVVNILNQLNDNTNVG